MLRASPLRCTLCNRPERSVGKLIHAPSDIKICPACIQICNEMLDERTALLVPRMACPGNVCDHGWRLERRADGGTVMRCLRCGAGRSES